MKVIDHNSCIAKKVESYFSEQVANTRVVSCMS